MNYIRVAKVLGLLGALLSGGSLLLGGQIEQGVGIISAALGSAGLFSKPSV